MNSIVNNLSYREYILPFGSASTTVLVLARIPNEPTLCDSDGIMNIAFSGDSWSPANPDYAFVDWALGRDGRVILQFATDADAWACAQDLADCGVS